MRIPCCQIGVRCLHAAQRPLQVSLLCWVAPELFDLENDPEETTNLANDSAYEAVLQKLENELRRYLNPGIMNEKAKNQQAELVTVLAEETRLLEPELKVQRRYRAKLVNKI